MANKGARQPTQIQTPNIWVQLVKAWHDFLQLPTLLAAGLLLLAVVMILVDVSRPGWLAPVRGWLSRYLFTEAAATQRFLGTALAGLMTVTSITITTLLIALQQSASKLGIQVTNHFLDRRRNQVFYGLLIGVVIYVAVTYAASTSQTNFIFSATVGLLLVVIVVYALILLLWMTVNQMRPIVLMEHLHDQTLLARQRLVDEILLRTRRHSLHDGPIVLPVHLYQDGYVTDLDVDLLAAHLARAARPVEIVLRTAMGDHIAYGSLVAEIRAETEGDAALLAGPVRQAIRLGIRRDLSCDPDYGLFHFEMIAWSSVSTAIDDPEIGIQTLHAVHDVAARWLAAEAREQAPPDARRLPIVYVDSSWLRLLDVIEALTIVSSESMQHQVFSTALDVVRRLFPDLPPALQDRAAGLVRRALSAAGDFVLARQLEMDLQHVEQTLRSHGYPDAADDVARALDGLRQTVGALNSRATRVPGRS